jgi:sugar lactone lactonase YvrE
MSRAETPRDLKVFHAAGNLIGESPVWSAREQALYWVEVEGRAVFRRGWNDADVQSWSMPEPTGCIGLRARGGLVAAMRTGFVRLDTATGAIIPIVDPEADRPENRFNDGKVDRRGRFWAGTKNIANTPQPTGAIYRLEADGTAPCAAREFSCVNGIAWSPDGRAMYACDTWRRRLYAFDHDETSGTISNRRPFASVADEDGFPDGLTVDAEGCLWNAHYNGWRITRYTPDGRIDRVVAMPVQHVTSVTFGGPELRHLFVTSARMRLDNAALAAQFDAGHIFVFVPGAQGLPEPEFLG